MKITPLDIRQKRFETAMRGYERREVEAFLEMVAGEFEELVKENIALKEEHKRNQARLEHHQDRERALQETMVTAQKISEDVKEAAKKEAEIVVANAEHQAEKIVQSAHQRLVGIVNDINEMKRQRVQFESQLRSVVDAHRKLLETMHESAAEWQQQPSRADDKVAFLKKAGTES